MSTSAAIICLICVLQPFVEPVQFARPSTGRHGPLTWPPVALNHWNTLTLTSRLVALNEACGPNNPSAGWADIQPPGETETATNNTMAQRASDFAQLPGGGDFFRRPMSASVVCGPKWSSVNWSAELQLCAFRLSQNM